VKRHIRQCKVCGERHRRDVRPAILFGLLPVALMPDYLRQRILDIVVDDSSSAVAYRAHVVDRAAQFSAGGFPVQLTTPSAPGRRGTSTSAAAVAAAALALLSGGMYYVDHSSSHSAPAAASAEHTPAAGSTGSSGSRKVLAGGPSAVAPAPSPAPDLVPSTPGSTTPLSPLLFTLPGTTSPGLFTS